MMPGERKKNYLDLKYDYNKTVSIAILGMLLTSVYAHINITGFLKKIVGIFIIFLTILAIIMSKRFVDAAKEKWELYK